MNHVAHSVLNQQQQELSVLFDGKKLYVMDAEGTIVAEYYATSGKKGKFMNNPEYQNVSNKGPIPEGTCSFSNKNWKFQSELRQLYNLVTGQGDWGAANVLLKPISYKGSRHSFYIHQQKMAKNTL